MLENSKIDSQNELTEFLLYTSPDGKIKVDVYLRDENIWLTQDKIADLFGVDRTVITKHLKNIYNEDELVEIATSVKIAQVQTEGGRVVKREIKYYNLDAIIAVGYRVNSKRATQFRIWSNSIIKEYIIKGFTMDDERLKDPRQIFGKDYFEEQLQRIRDVRSSERRFYQKITDIYSQCSIDYDPSNEKTKHFYATIQNKFHFAITGQTASEIIKDRADSQKSNMGLTNWKNSPKGKIRKDDVIVAKNYLNKDELDQLNRIVNMYLDYAELQATNQKVMYMKDWMTKLDAFLKFNERDILQNLGTVSHQVALELAEKEFEKFNQKLARDYISDFDLEIEVITKRLGQ